MTKTILDNITLIHGDCMDYLRSLPDNAFELAIVDPPYQLPKDSSNGRGKLKNRVFNKGHISRWDFAPSPEYFEELRRISVNQIIWGGQLFSAPTYTRNHLLGQMPAVAQLFTS